MFETKEDLKAAILAGVLFILGVAIMVWLVYDTIHMYDYLDKL